MPQAEVEGRQDKRDGWVRRAVSFIAALDAPRRAPRAESEATARKIGRYARRPSEMTLAGWKDILWRVYREFSNDRIMLVAAGLTFYVLLAIFPAISALVSLYGLFSDPATIGTHLNLMSGILPAGGLQIVNEQMTRMVGQRGPTLTLGLVIGLCIALWSANSGMKSFFDALNIVYEEREKRSYLKRTLLSIGFTLAALAFLLIALAAVVVLPLLLDWEAGTTEAWLLFLRWPLLLVIACFGISIIFRHGPSRAPAKWRWISWGAVFAAVLWVLFSILFSWYAESFGSYDETYGSLGAVVGFMTWIWISWIVVLVGAELDAELEHQTAMDSTTSPDLPMGQRGATMADTLGESWASGEPDPGS